MRKFVTAFSRVRDIVEKKHTHTPHTHTQTSFLLPNQTTYIYEWSVYHSEMKNKITVQYPATQEVWNIRCTVSFCLFVCVCACLFVSFFLSFWLFTCLFVQYYCSSTFIMVLRWHKKYYTDITEEQMSMIQKQVYIVVAVVLWI